MKRLALSLCVLAAACGGRSVETPTSPSGGAPSPSATSASSELAHGTSLPFRGTFSIQTVGTVDCLPPCVPTILEIAGTEEGTASHLGQFTAVSTDVVDLATTTSVGTFTFTSANGDQLRATTVAREVAFVPPNASTIAGTGTITGGTGRFAAATGSFSYRITHYLSTGTSSGSGTFDGSLDLNP
jgi:hypothetical protein